MLCTRLRLAAVLLVAGSFHIAAAQTTTAPAATDAKPSKIKLTMQKLKEMKATWAANRPKLKACRKEVKVKGLTGDDRWFFIEDCMNKT
jgi:UDP-N-acetylglucosamine enolpyruvyl transferase